MKRLLAGLCALALALSLAACAERPAPSAPALSSDSAAASTAAPAAGTAAPPAIDESGYRLGCLDLEWRCPADWSLTDPTTLAEKNGAAALPEDLEQAMAGGGQLLIGEAAGPNGERWTLLLQSMSEEELAKTDETLLSDSREAVREKLLGAGLGEAELTADSADFCGSRLACLRAVCRSGSEEYAQLLLLLRPARGNYLGVLTLSSPDADPAELLKDFARIQ